MAFNAVDVLARISGDSSGIVSATAKASDSVLKMGEKIKATSGSIKASSVEVTTAMDKQTADTVRAAKATIDAQEAMAARVKAATAAMVKGVTADFTAMTEMEIVKSREAALKVVASHEEMAAGAAKANAKMATKLIQGAAVVTAALGVFAIDQAAKFEKSTELLRTAGGLTESELAKARDGILEISKSTGVAASDLSAGMYVVTKVTKDASEGLTILKAAAQGAVAEGVDMSTMVDALTSIMFTYNLTADKAVSTQNALIVASGASKTTMQEFAGSLSTVMPAAQQAGIGFDQIAGAIATMTQHGTTAQEATQELRNGILNLQAPNSVAVSEMGQLGVSANDIAQNLGKRGLTGTIDVLTQAVLNHIQGGHVLLDSYKESQMAASSLGTMFKTLPPDLQRIAQEMMNGKMTMNEYNKTIGHLSPQSYDLARQFETLWKKSNGFSDSLRAGGTTQQTFVQAMEKMTGGTTGLQVAMMLGGDNMAAFQTRVAEVGDAMQQSGDDIATNADTQATAAAAAARTKAEFEALAITIGNDLMPYARDFLKWLDDAIKWMEKNKSVIEAIAAGILALGAAMAVASLIAGGWVTLIVIAVGALVAGLVWAYNNVGWFKDAVNAAWKWIQDAAKNVFEWFRDQGIPWVVNAWNWLVKSITNTVGMFVDFFNNTVGMFHDFFTNTVGMFNDFFKHVGDAAMWLWHNIFEPVWNGIVTVGKWAFAIIATVIIGPMVALWNVLGEAFKWVYEHIIKPYWDFMVQMMTNVWKFLDTNVFTPFKKGLQIWGELFRVIYETIIKPAWTNLQNFIGTVWQWVSDNVISPWNRRMAEWGQFFKFVWEQVIKPAWKNLQDFIGTVWQWIGTNVIDPWNRSMEAWGRFFKWVYENVIRPTWENLQTIARMAWEWIDNNVFAKFRTGAQQIGDAFSTMGTVIGTVWTMIQNAAVAPVNFIIDTVINRGIIDTFNGAAKMVGLDAHLGHLATIPLPGGGNGGGKAGRVGGYYATGGIMPGYSPGVDNHIIAVGGGEAIMRPEWTRAIGAERIHAMNAMARGGNTAGIKGMMGFADGGIVGNLMGMITGPVSGMLSGLGSSFLVQTMSQIPAKMIEGLTTMAQNAFGAMISAVSGGGGGGNGGAGVQQWAGLVAQALSMLGQPADLLSTTLRRMNQESGGNAGAINNWDSNAAAGIPSKGLMQVIDPTFRAYAMPGYSSDIYDPLSNILASMRYAISRYGSLAGAYNQPGGYALGGIATFDNGGIVGPGLNLINNATGAPERLSNTTHGGLDGATIVLEIPELGGRLTAKVKEVIGETFSSANRSLRNSKNVPTGGF